MSLVLESHTQLEVTQASRLVRQGMHLWVEYGPMEFEQKMSECIRKAAERKKADDVDATIQLVEKLKKMEVEEPDDVLSKTGPIEDVEMGDTLLKTGPFRDIEMRDVPESFEASMSTGF